MARPKPYAIVEAPSHLGLRAEGVERLPEALLSAGLDERIGARRAARIDPPPFDPRIDDETGILNVTTLAEHSRALADEVEKTLDRDECPVVLGGDCTVLLGNALALRRRGRYGLLFLDAHADFYQPEAEPTGEGASMELALVTGRGPEVLTDCEERRPLVRDDDVVVLGRRDAEHARAEGSRPLAPTILSLDLDQVRAGGIERSTERALGHLERATSGFWIHLDADVLDDAVMPAVDYRLPGGLGWDELSHVLHMAVSAPGAAGIEITIFNPDLDADGEIAAAFVDALAAGLAP